MEFKTLKNEKTNEIINFLTKIGDDFDIHLSNRVNIEEYTKKVLKNGLAIVAEKDNKIIGILLMYANNTLTKEAYISLIGVDKLYRHQHVATKLLEEGINIAKNNDMETIKLYTHKKNINAQKMYEKNNFVQVESDREHSYCYIKQLKSILLTAIGSFSSDIAIKSLHKIGYEIIGTDIYDANWIVDSKNVNVFEKAPLVYEEEKYINFIKKLCNKYNIKYIIPSTDPEVDLLSKFKNEFKMKNVIICTSDDTVVKKCRNKLELPNKLRGIRNINIIETNKLINVDVEKIKFPIIIKPINGRSSQECYKIFDSNQLKFYKEICKNIDNMIVQPLIEGNIITVDVVSDICNDICICIPRRELLRTGNGAGTTVETFYDEKLINACKEIATTLKINGAVNIEFIEKNKDEYYFLEINPRFSGGLEFSHIEGYNVVENHLKCFKNEKIDKNIIYKDMIIARKYEEYIMKG